MSAAVNFPDRNRFTCPRIERFCFRIAAAKVRAFPVLTEHLLAVTPQTNEAFLREVDEELRRDQALGLWRRYGRAGLAAVAAALVALAAFLGWQHYRQQAAAAQTDQFNSVYSALTAGNYADADKPLADLAKSDITPNRALARFLQADLVLRDLGTNNPAQTAAKLRDAAAKFALVANDASVPPALRELALIRQTFAEYDTLPPQTVIDRLKPLTVKGGPWLGSAGELVVHAQLQLGKTSDARAVLDLMMADPTMPESIRQRAVQLVGSIGAPQPPTTQEKKSK